MAKKKEAEKPQPQPGYDRPPFLTDEEAKKAAAEMHKEEQ